MKGALFIAMIFMVTISLQEDIVETGTGHLYPRTIRNCVLNKLGHLKTMKLPIHLVIGSISVYNCYDNNVKTGYLFKLKAYRRIARKALFGLGFVNYIENLMHEKRSERITKFETTKNELIKGLELHKVELINKLQKVLEFLSKSTRKTPQKLVELHKSDEIKLTKEIQSVLNPEKKQLLTEFKEKYFDMFITEDLNLISNAMGNDNDSNIINTINQDYELILEYSQDNTIKVFLNDLRTTKFYRQIDSGEYIFKRFIHLLYERYFPSNNFK